MATQTLHAHHGDEPVTVEVDETIVDGRYSVELTLVAHGGLFGAVTESVTVTLDPDEVRSLVQMLGW